MLRSHRKQPEHPNSSSWIPVVTLGKLAVRANMGEKKGSKGKGDLQTALKRSVGVFLPSDVLCIHDGDKPTLERKDISLDLIKR